MTRTSWSAGLVFATFAFTLGAGAQDSRPASAVVGAALDSATSVQIGAVVAEARSQGLPVDPIVAKVRLGALRHAPDSLIVAAAKAVSRRLAIARTALQPQPAPGDIAAGADALSTGVTPEALRMIRDAAGNRPVAVPLGVVAELTATGVPPARAATIISTLMRRGAPARQLVSLGNDVNADVEAGARADASLGVRMRRLEAILPARAPGLPAAATTSSPGKGGG